MGAPGVVGCARRAACATAARPAPGPDDEQAIAVVGMGCVFPGATGVAAYWDLLRAGRDPKTCATPDRWRADLACRPGPAAAFASPTSLGGYLTDFAYDWRTHKVPPKQLAQADPLQFMLLEAADQALHDAGWDAARFPRERVGVIVGTEFGGDFAFQMEVALRLPELQKILVDLLARRGMSRPQARKLFEQFSAVLLEHWPALFDETGSFSTNSLSSRIAKTWDLMGGAAAIDAGEGSSLAGLALCVDLLLAGDCDLMVCAAGQRRMALPVYEALSLGGLLSASPHPRSPFDAAADGYVPGEGAGALLLKRLSDARRDGDKIRAIIRGVGGGRDPRDKGSLQLAVERSLAIAAAAPQDLAFVEADGHGLPAADNCEIQALLAVQGPQPRREPLVLSSVVGQIGHLGGASGMASLIKAVLELEHGEVPATFGLQTPLSSLAGSPAAIQAAVRATPLRLATRDGRRLAGVGSSSRHQSFHAVLEAAAAQVPVAAESSAKAAAGTTSPAIGESCASGPRGPRHFGPGWPTMPRMVPRRPPRCSRRPRRALYARRPRRAWRSWLRVRPRWSRNFNWPKSSFASRRPGRHWSNAAFSIASLPRNDRGSRFCSPARAPSIPACSASWSATFRPRRPSSARSTRCSIAHGFQSFGQIAWQENPAFGSDVWTTQVAMLLADTIMAAALADRGIRPDLVSGHSYGEYPALVAAGAWTFEEALRVTRARCDAIDACPTARGGMLATNATPEVIERLAAGLRDRVYVANHNAPEQTVVAGRRETLAEFAGLLERSGCSARLLAVPSPFHSPLMAGAAPAFREAVRKAALVRPALPVISVVTNRVVTEPEEIRENLVAHLTTPVRYVELVRQIASQGPTVFVEVGPQQVLTRLNRSILPVDRAETVACDHPKRPGVEPLCCVQALLECTGRWTSRALPPQAGPKPGAVRGEILHWDATARRREKMRRAATDAPLAPSPASAAPTKAAPADAAPAKAVPVAAPAKPPAALAGVAPTAKVAGAAAGLSGSVTPSVAAAPAPAELESFLINFVVEQTGYPPEVVELDADLEADLGIDSIKKAQLFGELREYFDITPGENLTLDDFPTLRHVLDYLRGAPSKLEPAAAVSAPAGLVASAAPAAAVSATSGLSGECGFERDCRTRPRGTGIVPDQFRRGADRLSARGGGVGCRPGGGPGDRQHQEGPVVRRAARVFRHHAGRKPDAGRLPHAASRARLSAQRAEQAGAGRHGNCHCRLVWQRGFGRGGCARPRGTGIVPDQLSSWSRPAIRRRWWSWTPTWRPTWGSTASRRPSCSASCASSSTSRRART